MFQLSKWYLDCVTDTGDAVILYWASIRWGPLRLHYGATLQNPASGEPTHRYTLRPGSEPAVVHGEVQWACPRLGFSGTWSARSAGIERTLLDGPQGMIHWHCVSPRAAATVRIGDDMVQGQAYVEHLTMTLKPWRLPFDELQWGRFLSPADTLIWIQWRGSMPRTWVWLNGAERRRAGVTEDRVELPEDGVVLDLRGGRVLRSGRLASTALRSIRAFTALIPRWRTAHETKWLTRGTLSRHDETSAGWAVHEVVRWP
jgi:hypothetical protein